MPTRNLTRKTWIFRRRARVQGGQWRPMRNAPAESAHVVEGRVLAELDALRMQVAALQRLLLQREPLPFASAGRIGTEVAGAPTLFASFFGGFTLYRAGRRLSLGGSRPVCELGTYLIAHAGRAVARDALMDLLWPEADPARAAHRLHVAVSDLRRIVDVPGDTSVVRLQDDSYQIGACSVATDCELFEQHHQRGRRALSQGDRASAAIAFDAALQLYTGEFLADHPYLEWAAQKRAHYAEQQLGALTALCEYAAERRDYAAVEDYARAILVIDNLREQAHRHLMRAHYHCGRRASAIRQYRTCTADLDRELGARPSLLTQQLHDAICHDNPLPGEMGPTE